MKFLTVTEKGCFMQKMKKAGYILLALLLALLLGLSAYAEQTAAEESAPPLEIEQPGQSGSGS